MWFLYNFSIKVYFLFIQLAAIFGNKKAKLWLEGRLDWVRKLKVAIPTNTEVIWFHTASLGEFEQARPLIELIKRENPHFFLLLTFFSPSGYEIRKKYSHADFICYLPLDTKFNARIFVHSVRPKLVVFVKYEFWFNYLNELKKNKVKTILISGIFRDSQHFFKYYGGWFKDQLKAFDHFYLQNNSSKKLLESIGFHNATVAGDTRFDRVVEVAKQGWIDKRFESFCNSQKIIIFGSSWGKENEFAILLNQNEPQIKLIIAPHEIDLEKTKLLKKSFSSKVILLSETAAEQDLEEYDILIVDQIGLLSRLYCLADIAVIGGGFGSGIHNILEAAVYGCPTFFGPNYQKFHEARCLIERKGAYSINDYEDLEEKIKFLLKDPKSMARSSMQAKQYVIENAGATSLILNEI